MKRYGTKITTKNPPFPGTLEFGELPDGPLVFYSDVQAWALKLKATVEELSCDEDCASVTIKNDEDGQIRFGTGKPCNCPRGEALRLIGEVC